MDKGMLGAISTVLMAIAFAGVCWWAFAPKRRKRFDDAANLPFADEGDDVTNNDDNEVDESDSSTDDVARRD
ncbi:cbb3-type cytochrome oxidase subunit 3 [Gilvimarinus sp. 1_MG-2023]|uniref:cbb3-type cytochrome oxidase subunit 3 n=1 Tax=Gilvimarinus sp. 1_MG-2023 TaxID=3062638 RepID=UPI0026E3DCD3|nr:cbb3-type cytochrome c oxidase subunit 3 [Gilvimarinus sp. 1_MG-2023]MDO6747917.1 cbb3-type cytochrome c oxidase subunit 3 [Gilvimarinus sp. 1_MG-2023]